MEVDTVIIRNMVVVMDTALLVDTDILMEAEVTENMEDTEITDTNRIMVEVMAMDIPLMEAMVMAGMEVTGTEAMVVTVATSLEAMAVTVATNSEVMEVVMATLIPIILQTKMNTSRKRLFLKSFFNHVFYSVISN